MKESSRSQKGKMGRKNGMDKKGARSQWSVEDSGALTEKGKETVVGDGKKQQNKIEFDQEALLL